VGTGEEIWKAEEAGRQPEPRQCLPTRAERPTLSVVGPTFSVTDCFFLRIFTVSELKTDFSTIPHLNASGLRLEQLQQSAKILAKYSVLYPLYNIENLLKGWQNQQSLESLCP
jgi:hypothetical protein